MQHFQDIFCHVIAGSTGTILAASESENHTKLEADPGSPKALVFLSLTAFQLRYEKKGENYTPIPEVRMAILDSEI